MDPFVNYGDELRCPTYEEATTSRDYLKRHSSQMPLEDSLDESICKDWSGIGSHVDFGPNDAVPLEPGRYLGRGAVAEVYEARCRGTVLALKRKYCRKRVTEDEKREIEILRKLSHIHVIRMIGTYTHGPFLGILLFPVAVCDLATFFDDFQSVYAGLQLFPEQTERLSELGLPVESWRQGGRPECSFLLSKIGCLASAIQYFHSERVRHRDLKPSNILLSRGRVWVTDFGSSTDFSARSTSQTEGGDRGTPRYFAPEVARYLKSGRAADIFSLGCIFLEAMTLCLHGSLVPLKALCSNPDNYNSFQANLDQMDNWMRLLDSDVSTYRHTVCEIMHMLAENAEARPTARDVYQRLLFIDQFGADRLFDHCCRTKIYNSHDFQKITHEMEGKILDLEEKNRGLEIQLATQRRAFVRLELRMAGKGDDAAPDEHWVQPNRLAATPDLDYDGPRHRRRNDARLLRVQRLQHDAASIIDMNADEIHATSKRLSPARFYTIIMLIFSICWTTWFTTFVVHSMGRKKMTAIKGVIFGATVLVSCFTVMAMVVGRRSVQEALLAGLLEFLIGFALLTEIQDFVSS